MELSRNYNLIGPYYSEVQEQGNGHEDKVYAELYESPSTKEQEVVKAFGMNGTIPGVRCFGVGVGGAQHRLQGG